MNESVALQNDSVIAEEKTFCTKCGAKLTNKRCCLHCGAMVDENEIQDFLDGKNDEVSEQFINSVKKKYAISMIFYYIVLASSVFAFLVALAYPPFWIILIAFIFLSGSMAKFAALLYLYFFIVFISSALGLANSIEYQRYVNKGVGIATSILTGITMISTVAFFIFLLLA